MTSLYAGPTAPNLARIPAELITRPQWVLWRGEDRIDQQTGDVKLNKIPYTTDPGKKADSTDPQTWTSFQRCMDALPVALEEWESEAPSAYRGGGLGFVFAPDDPYCGIDLDHCIDAETGAIAGWADTIIATLSSYAEASPSGTGAHIVVQGTLPPRGRKKGPVEMYDQGRFFTMTGRHISGTPDTIEARQDALSALHLDIFGLQTQPPQQNGPIPEGARPPLLDDAALLSKARQATNGSKFAALWAGDTSAYGGDDSSADMALCAMLSFWTTDPAQLDRLFRQSGLMRPKWDTPRGEQTYGERTIGEARALQREHYNGTPPPAADQRPAIRISTDMTAVVDALQQALLTMPAAPQLFQRAHQLCLIAHGVTPPKWLHRAPEAPVIVPADPAYLRELATQAAQWHKLDKRAHRWEPALPPLWTIETLLARPAWPFPVLEGVIGAPTLRPDGSTLATPGYDPDTGLVLDLNGTAYPPIRERPTLDDARSAIGLLQQVFIDFPFAAPHHFSAALAAVLSLVCRCAIQGNVPLFAVRSTTRGAGKGLLIDAVSVLATGRHAPRWAQTQEEEEERKRLLTLALAGDAVIHIDNVRHTLGSSPLDLALTAPTVTDRILGKHASREAPLHAVFFASGNNMAFRGDTARRVVPIDLTPQMERPEERDSFTHSPLLPWVQAERPRLVVAAVTILKAFFAAGCPAQGVTPYGSFEQWSDLVRHALIWAGEADPCAGRKDLEADSDPAYEALATLLECWQACYPARENGAWPETTLKQVVNDIITYAQHVGPTSTANKWNALQDALGAYDRRYEGKRLDTTAIGNRLRGIKGRVIQGKRLRNARDKEKNALLWCAETLST